jgi:hypothetical protein
MAQPPRDVSPAPGGACLITSLLGVLAATMRGTGSPGVRLFSDSVVPSLLDVFERWRQAMLHHFHDARERHGRMLDYSEIP